jgi:predicted phosphodiesterase
MSSRQVRPLTAGRRPSLTVAARLAVAVLLGLAGGWLGLTVAGSVHHEVGPLTTSMRVVPQWGGGTVVQIAPLGELRLDTHAGPLGIQATLDGFDVDEARALVTNPERLGTLKPEAVADITWAVKMAVLRGLAAALVGAALLAGLASRRVLSAAVGGGTVLVAAGCSLALAVTGWNPNALAEPRYTGLLSTAPSVVGTAESIVTDFSTYGDQLAQIVGNVSGLYTATSSLPLLPDQDEVVKILHVSDLHLAPQAWDVIATVAQQYDVDVIVDSGDITDHGSRAENRYVEEVRRMPAPYVWVRGNHDSAVTQRAMRQVRNGIVLDGRPREVAGLTFLGLGDPTFTPDKSLDNDARLVTEATEDLAAAAENLGGVDVLVFHDPTDAALLDGQAPLALFGHKHYRKVERGETGTFLMTQGSTGASGLRALEPEEPTDMLLSVLYVDRRSHQLRAYDDIRLGGLGSASALINRQVVDGGDDTTMVAPEPLATADTPAEDAAGTEGE